MSFLLIPVSATTGKSNLANHALRAGNFAACCACAASGRVAAAPQSNVVNSRRLMDIPASNAPMLSRREKAG